MKCAQIGIAVVSLLLGFSQIAQAADGADLTLSEAQARKARLSQIKYQLNVNLPDKGETYSGTQHIDFELSDIRKPLRLDFFGGKVRSMELNGRRLPKTAQKKDFILLPVAALKTGINSINIDYTAKYSHQSQGLSQFVDPETKETFLFSQFESFDANRFMPCFDQPDLRASLSLSVEAPASWQVVSTTRETSLQATKEKRRVWTFPATPPLATYLFSLHAGPFKVWQDQFDGIPLRIFARPSMAKYIPVEDWFRWTKNGLKFYNDYFAFKYPFKKYDQLILPELPDAMENVAAVTFSEEMFPRSKATRPQGRLQAETLLHEMAHMWFGDVVTMSWWQDLWLNESFASFMSALALLKATEFNEAWQHFFVEFKAWGYREDEMLTRHAIEAPIPSVRESNAIYDGITYGKGAGSLKQLWAYMGPEKFQQGLREYIQTYAFQNANLDQFVAILQKYSSSDLKQWTDRWLKQVGTDLLEVQWKCDGQELKEIKILTKVFPGTVYRPQGVDVALVDSPADKPTVVHAQLEAPQSHIRGNWSCPNFVYPNFNDNGYAQVQFDPASLEWVKKNLAKIQDPLLRLQIWNDLWASVRAAEFTLPAYVKVVMDQFPQETDPMVLQAVVTTISGRPGPNGGTVLEYWTPGAKRDEFLGQMEELYLRRLKEAQNGGDEQKFWFESFTSIAQSHMALAKVNEWAHGKNLPAGMDLNLDQRWMLTRQLMRFEWTGANLLALNLKKEDPSDRGQEGAIAAEAIEPNLKVKSKWVNILKVNKLKLSNQQANSAFYSLFPLEQRGLAQRFAADFYKYLNANGNSENEDLVKSFAETMNPLNCRRQESEPLRQFLSRNREKFSPTVQKSLLNGLQEDERCQKIRAAAGMSVSGNAVAQ